MNFTRPSIDVFFESAAEVYEKRILAIILSGANADGADGIKKIIACGGQVLVQDPNTTEHPQMPAAAAVHAPVSSIITVSQLNNIFSEIEGLLCRW